MKNYIKYLILIILIILSIVSVWYFFIRKNPEIEEYEKKFYEKVNNVNNSNNIQQPVIKDPILEENNEEGNVTVQKPIIDETTVKPNDNPVIISSETKILNEQGQELLDELSKELEQSFQTISTTDAVIDDDILNTESDINLGE